MSEYDYGNARLRAMKARLLSPEQFARLAEVRSIDLLVTELSSTPYQRAAEIAIVRSVGLGRVTTMLQQHLLETVARIRHFFPGEAEELIAILWKRYDIHNLKTVLRGLSQHVPVAQMTSALLPIGDLTHNILAQLIGAEQPRIAIDLLASMRFAVAAPLIKLRGQQPNASIARMEICLEQWYFQYAYDSLERLGQQDSALMQALLIEADVINLLTTLRFVHTTDEPQRLFAQLQINTMSETYVRAGKLSHQLLEQVAEIGTLEEAVDSLRPTLYGEALSTALNRYLKTKLLSEFDRELQRYRLRMLARHIVKDPLGVGVPLGYLALKENEIRNIRAIAWGIQLGHDADTIKKDLEFVA